MNPTRKRRLWLVLAVVAAAGLATTLANAQAKVGIALSVDLVDGGDGLRGVFPQPQAHLLLGGDGSAVVALAEMAAAANNPDVLVFSPRMSVVWARKAA